MPPAIFTIPAGSPFLDRFVAGLMRRTRAKKDPLALARITVLLPTRRAARSLREAFLRETGGKALLLPKMLPVGDLDVEELAFQPEEIAGTSEAFDLPPAVPELRRMLLLTQLVRKFGVLRDGRMLWGQAAPLARELARFLDEVQSEGGDLAGLEALVPSHHAEHWQQVLNFLVIVRKNWPVLLEANGCLDPADRRNRVLALQAGAWQRSPPTAPVIAAGITGGLPAVRALLKVVATLPHGAVVLPGLDTDADGASWEEVRIDPTHPQYLMARFLEDIEIEPKSVETWGARAAASRRAALVREMLAPASLSHRWRFISDIGAPALTGLRRIDCGNQQEEALSIALLLRQALEKPGATAALVTPDRDLARRVAAELRRWKIDIDDSAGVPLNKTPPGVFLRLVLDCVAEQMAPLPLLAALKHPLAAGGLAPGTFRERVRLLEIAALRGPRPGPVIEGLRKALAERETATPLLDDLVGRIERALSPLVAALDAETVSLPDLVAAHIAACEALAASDAAPGAAQLWREAAGEAASLFLNELMASAGDFPLLAGSDYPALFEALLAGPVVRPAYGRHPRLSVWGLLEARLQQADLVVLGGLNEGTWPAAAANDPWLSRPMRQQFGMPAPEQRIGVAALDFALALGASEAVMTRATRVEGTPTVPSRWLLRLDTVLGAVDLAGRLEADAAPRDWQALLDRPSATVPMAEPAPRPPVAARPRRLSISDIETWRRDPYAIYARHVLRLKPLEPLDQDPGAAERGIIVHAALANFLKAYPRQLPADAAERLEQLGLQSFGAALARPGVWAFWWPRFQRVASWVAAQEAERRGTLEQVFAEIEGRIEIDGPAGKFCLVGRADRIEMGRDGRVRIIDYKTGAVPAKRDVHQGVTPQLALEALMAERGGFAEFAPAASSLLAYWHVTGGDPPGAVEREEDDPAILRALIDAARDGLARFVAAYDDPATPYLAVPDAALAPHYSDYAHLERLKERLAGEEDAE